MAEITLKQQEIFSIINKVALAALRNHMTIEKSAGRLTEAVKAIEQSKAQMASAIAADVQKKFTAEFNGLIQQASTRIAEETAKKLTQAHKDAQNAAAAYREAAENTFWRTAITAAVIATFFSVIVDIALRWFRG